MASLLSEIVIDSANAEAQARWWGEVLDWPVAADPRGFFWLSASGRPGDLPMLVFQPVPEPKTAKNRVHIDVNPRGCDQAEELDRLLALGARKVDVGQGDAGFIVLADPEGNEFCLLGRRVD
jgi:hypothetical protein